ncbi:MAG: SLC13 family permease [Kiloniellales bacterium]
MTDLTTEQITIFAILVALFGLMVWGRWRYDVVAFVALLACVLVGLVPAGEAFNGFGHPATITVAAVLVISRALAGAGATDALVRLVLRAAKRLSLHIAGLAGLGALLSCFMNNVGTLGLMMPVALQSARKAKRSPALLLMPLSFGTILGGLVTLIGTPPNIIVAAYRGEVAGSPFGMFDFSPVGGVVALAGLAFVALIGWRLVPKRAVQRAAAEDIFGIEDYVAEARIVEDSKAAGLTLAEIAKETEDIDVQLISLIRGEQYQLSLRSREQLRPGDLLLFEAGPEAIDQFVSKLGLKISGPRKARESLTQSPESALAEMVVTPGSQIEGRRVSALRLQHRFGVNLLAVSRQGRPHRGRLRHLQFRIGDVLLLHGDPERLPEVTSRLGCLPLAERELSFGLRGKAPWLIAVFAGAIALASFGVISMPIALALAVAIMVVAGLMPLRELYEGIDWPVIVLLGSLIPVGGVLQSTGATGVIAGAILTLTTGFGAVAVLVLLMVVTMTLSDILNNAATAVIMAPIGLSLATLLDVNPDAFFMAVAVGASCAFLTPIGHQNNALILGPGGYSFGDYWHMGLPLELLIVAVATPMILLVWPL